MSVIKNGRKNDPIVIPMLVIITDGRSNIAVLEGADPLEEIQKLGTMAQEEGIFSIVIDNEVTSKNRFIDFSFEFAKDIADYLGTNYYRLDQLDAVSLGNLIVMVRDLLRKGIANAQKGGKGLKLPLCKKGDARMSTAAYLEVGFWTLMVATLVLAFTHTISPDHWFPFVVVGRTNKWSLPRTLALASLAGLGHVLTSVAIGLVGMFRRDGDIKDIALFLENATPLSPHRIWLLLCRLCTLQTAGRRPWPFPRHSHSQPMARH